MGEDDGSGGVGEDEEDGCSVRWVRMRRMAAV